MMFQEHTKVKFLSIIFISTVQYLNCSGHFLSNASKCRKHPRDNNVTFSTRPPPPSHALKQEHFRFPFIDVIFATGVRTS